MKYLLCMLILTSLKVWSQPVQILDLEKVTVLKDMSYYHPKFDQTGSRLLLTSENYKGLDLLDLESGKIYRISESEGAGYSPVFTRDNYVVYTDHEFIQNRRFTRLHSWDPLSGETSLLEPASRNLSHPMVWENSLLLKVNGQLKSVSPDSGSEISSDGLFTGIEDRQLVLYHGETRLVIQPYEDESYIWPSVSPDRKHILAYAMGKGTFICDLTGMLLSEPGRIEAPVWVGNDYITGMLTRDDGHQILESRLVLANPLTGEQVVISPKGLIAMHPAVSLKAGRIAFHTPQGEIYLIRFRINPE